MHYKQKPNNAKTTWKCPDCALKVKQQGKPTSTRSVPAGGSTNPKANGNTQNPMGNLTQNHYDLISNPSGWLDCDIIQEVHIYLKKIDPTMEGLQWPVLGPARRFQRVAGQFIQILHTGNSHWVCVTSVGVDNGTVNLYDSLYHNVIQKEVEEQVINLVGQSNYSGLQVVGVQQQNNGSDCGVFAAAFATCLANGILPQSVQFDIPKMRSHLLKCLKSGQMELFPTF